MKNLPSIASQTKAQGISRQWLAGLLPGLLLLIILLLWETGVRAWQVEKWLLPAPSAIFSALWQARELIFAHGLQTLYEAVTGLAIAIVVAIAVATLIDLSDLVRQAVYPLLVITQTIPIIAIAPLFIIWFGYGMTAKVVVVALVCFFPIAVNLADGYRLVDPDAVHLLAAMGAGKVKIFRMVKLPATLPFFFSGLRIAGTYSVMGAVIGEWLGASKGLGILMTRSSSSFLTDRVFATIIVITGLSLAVLLGIELLARLIMPWFYQQKKETYL